MPNTAAYRVVRWTTGNVGKSAVEAIAKNPTYELVGCYAWSKDKAGVDVGELVGIEPLGVKATNDVDELLGLKPDSVIYNPMWIDPMWIDVDELVRILSAGVNVVTSASFITGDNLGEGRDRIEEAVRLVADSLGVELDEVVCEAEYEQTTEDLEMASWTIKAGHVAGVFASWQGRVGGKTVVDLNVRWRKGQTPDPDWEFDGDGWKITIEGRPTVNMQIGFLPPQDMIDNAKSLENFFVLGHIMTARPPIHAIPGVVAAAPGIATYNDLPLPQARGVAPRS